MKSEFQTLKDQATLMQINVSPNMKETPENIESLKERIAEKIAKVGNIPMATTRNEKEQYHKEAMLLKHVIISTNNSNKKEYQGDILFAGNSNGIAYKKFVPFDRKTHIPTIMYNVLKEKQCQQFYKVKDLAGNSITKTRMINEYNIEVLPAITKKEWEAIRQRQLLDDGKE